MIGSQNIRQKKARHKRVYVIQVHSYEVLGLAKLIYGARNQKLAPSERERAQTPFWGSWKCSVS